MKFTIHAFQGAGRRWGEEGEETQSCSKNEFEFQKFSLGIQEAVFMKEMSKTYS